ncbi:MAG: FAD binding domain-containing protein [Victivallales bacterium]|nr:FAD binding domain-containing protein [Victivallales bacterium]
MISCIVNNKTVETGVNPGISVLEFVREELNLTGTKEGCKEGECGACTVLVGELHENGTVKYKACASCLLPLGEIDGRHIVTVEGLDSSLLRPVQKAVFNNNASQCGFCTPGIVLSLTGFLLTSESFGFNDALDALDGNICRCTGYASIRKAAEELSIIFKDKKGSVEKENRVEQLIDWEVLPEYFRSIGGRLENMIYSPSNISMFNENKVLIAGGTDLLVQKPEGLLAEDLVFASKLDSIELKQIKEANEYLHIGGAVTVEQLRKSEIIHKYFPSLENDLLLVSSTVMRNCATVAGNIVNASPIGDITIILLALNTRLILRKDHSRREVMLDKFYKGYKLMDIGGGEIIEKIVIPLPDETSLFNFEKVSNRKYLDIASCNSAVSIKTDNKTVQEITVSVGGVAPVPLLQNEVGKFLKGKNISTENLIEAGKILTSKISPIDDIRGTAEYKKLLTRQLLYSHFVKLFPDKIKYEEVAG